LGLLYVHIISNYNFIKLHLKSSGLLCYCEEMLMTTLRMQPQAGGVDRPSSWRRVATHCPSLGQERPSPAHERRGERQRSKRDGRPEWSEQGYVVSGPSLSSNILHFHMFPPENHNSPDCLYCCLSKCRVDLRIFPGVVGFGFDLGQTNLEVSSMMY
jgi:hypothetical protein